MTRQLHPGFERLIGAAAVDRKVRAALLRDPRSAALAFGLTAPDADIVADIRASDLKSFAMALLPRIYGEAAYTQRAYARVS